MIDVIHDGMNLPFRAKVRVTNVKQAMGKLRRLLDAKRPRGMRLRYLEDSAAGTVWLEARNDLPFITAMRTLRDASLLRSN